MLSGKPGISAPTKVGFLTNIYTPYKEAMLREMAKLMDLEVWVMGGGKERTQDQYRELLQSSGFELTRVVPTQESISILEALRLP